MADALPELNSSVTWSSPTRPTSRWTRTPPCRPRFGITIRRWRCSPAPTGWTRSGWCAVAARLLRPAGFVCIEHADVKVTPPSRCWSGPAAFRGVRDHRDLTGRSAFRRPAVQALTGTREQSHRREDVYLWQDGRVSATADEPEPWAYRRFDCTGDDPDVLRRGDRGRPAGRRAGECVVLPTDTVYGIGGGCVQRLRRPAAAGRQGTGSRHAAAGVDRRAQPDPRPGRRGARSRPRT